MARFSCHDPNHVWDLIPCDMVGSLILAAGAALYTKVWTSLAVLDCKRNELHSMLLVGLARTR
jgi:hypothetical protein